MDKYELRRLKLKELLDQECDGKVAVLAKRIGRSDSYVARMLYPPEKAGYKRIGEDMADVIINAFGLAPSAFERPSHEDDQPRQLQWVTQRESMLLTLFRATDTEGQDSMLGAGESVQKHLLTRTADH